MDLLVQSMQRSPSKLPKLKHSSSRFESKCLQKCAFALPWAFVLIQILTYQNCSSCSVPYKKKNATWLWINDLDGWGPKLNAVHHDGYLYCSIVRAKMCGHTTTRKERFCQKIIRECLIDLIRVKKIPSRMNGKMSLRIWVRPKLMLRSLRITVYTFSR